MEYKIKMLILKFQESLFMMARSRAFLYLAAMIILGLVVTSFTTKTRKTCNVDFYTEDAIETRQAEIKLERDADVTMGEVNRMVKLLTFIFNDLIVNKTSTLEGISEEYKDVDTYELKIDDIKKCEEGYSITFWICIKDDTYEELVYTPHKKYEAIISQNRAGFRLEYINIFE